MKSLYAALEENETVLADGAMGTMLYQAGLKQDESPVSWNLTRPEQVAAVHRDYLQAGAQILLTNTFVANRFRLARMGLDTQLRKLNRAAVEILQSEVQAAGATALVAGDIGPCGELLAPYGSLEFDQARMGFAQQAEILLAAGVDLIWIETLSDLEEARAAIEGVRSISPGFPLIVTLTFDQQGRTMMGVTPEQALSALTSMEVSAMGGNCGNGPEEIIGVIEKMHMADPQAILVAKANAGIPQLVNGKPVYRAEPPAMAQYALKARSAGARIIGACCGSTPAHIRAMAQALTNNTTRAD
jgi:5-methyltetrahydrofolate--homocysteine methyltransferase